MAQRSGGTAIGLVLASILALGLAAAPATAQLPFAPQAGAGASAVAPQANVTLRPELFIAGSSSMKGYVETAAKHLENDFAVPPPTISLKGSTTGIEEFCGGLGPQYPDITASWRGMHKSEFDRCVANGVLDIIEIKIGLSALYFVVRKGDEPFNVTPRMLFYAMAAQIPEDGEFVDNPNKTWRQVSKDAPDLPIRVLLPEKNSGTRFTFDSMVLQAGCRRVREIDRIFAAVDRVPRCITVRTDHVGTLAPPEMRMEGGRMVAVPEPEGKEFERIITEVLEPYEAKMVELLVRAPAGTIAIMAGEVYDAHVDVLQPLSVSGVMPSDAAIERFDYDLATPNFFYFKRGHMRDNSGRGVVRGIREFMGELVSDELMGRDGIFVRNFGLIPLSRSALEVERRKVQTLKRFVR